MEKTWTPNEKQKQFIDYLKGSESGLTLRDIEKNYNIKFATGTINTLVSKGLVNIVGEKVYTCECCGHKSSPVKVYKLA